MGWAVSRFFLGDKVHERGKPELVGTVLDAHRESKLGYTLEVHWHRSAEHGGDFVNFQHPDDLVRAEGT